MNPRLILAVALLAPLFFAAVLAQPSGGGTGWHNGDWQSGIPGLLNWYVAPDNYARVYDQFQVPDGGWTIVAVFSDNALVEFPSVTEASWEIRRGMVPGSGGEVVASGLAAVNPIPDPSVTAPKYPASEVAKHFRIQVNNLSVQLPAGHYWLSVAPVGSGKTYASPTLGSNAVGVDQNGLGLALFDRPNGPRFAIAESVGCAGEMGIARHFSQGVIVAK
jgi:hypothetical protein